MWMIDFKRSTHSKKWKEISDDLLKVVNLISSSFPTTQCEQL
jgi:hypothetical protein